MKLFGVVALLLAILACSQQEDSPVDLGGDKFKSNNGGNGGDQDNGSETAGVSPEPSSEPSPSPSPSPVSPEVQIFNLKNRIAAIGQELKDVAKHCKEIKDWANACQKEEKDALKQACKQDLKEVTNESYSGLLAKCVDPYASETDRIDDIYSDPFRGSSLQAELKALKGAKGLVGTITGDLQALVDEYSAVLYKCGTDFYSTNQECKDAKKEVKDRKKAKKTEYKVLCNEKKDLQKASHKAEDDNNKANCEARKNALKDERTRLRQQILDICRANSGTPGCAQPETLSSANPSLTAEQGSNVGTDANAATNGNPPIRSTASGVSLSDANEFCQVRIANRNSSGELNEGLDWVKKNTTPEGCNFYEETIPRVLSQDANKDTFERRFVVSNASGVIAEVTAPARPQTEQWRYEIYVARNPSAPSVLVASKNNFTTKDNEGTNNARDAGTSMVRALTSSFCDANHEQSEFYILLLLKKDTETKLARGWNVRCGNGVVVNTDRVVNYSF